MSTRKFWISFTFSTLFATVTFAQGKLAEEADAAYKDGFYFNAIELYKKAYTMEKKASDKAAHIFKVGECYRALGDAQSAQVWYEKANKAQYADPITYFYIGAVEGRPGTATKGRPVSFMISKNGSGAASFNFCRRARSMSSVRAVTAMAPSSLSHAMYPKVPTRTKPA